MGVTADEACDLGRAVGSGRPSEWCVGTSMKKLSGACPEPVEASFWTERRGGNAVIRLAEAPRTPISFFPRVLRGLDPMLEAGLVGRYTLAFASSSDDESSLELESEDESDSSSDSDESELSDPEESEDGDESLGVSDLLRATCRRDGS